MEKLTYNDIRKYESVYKNFINSGNFGNKKIREENNKEKEPPTRDSRGRKKLSEYQKFVKEESKKEKYKSLKPEERLKKIAKLWKKQQKSV